MSSAWLGSSNTHCDVPRPRCSPNLIAEQGCATDGHVGNRHDELLAQLNAASSPIQFTPLSCATLGHARALGRGGVPIQAATHFVLPPFLPFLPAPFLARALVGSAVVATSSTASAPSSVLPPTALPAPLPAAVTTALAGGPLSAFATLLVALLPVFARGGFPALKLLPVVALEPEAPLPLPLPLPPVAEGPPAAFLRQRSSTAILLVMSRYYRIATTGRQYLRFGPAFSAVTSCG